ncbi:MAG: PepSY domain-containing protein [Gammaproteobacteria bacterium]|nr:PepSY domain-containing protein [Gammaproteobacteria bacterium]
MKILIYCLLLLAFAGHCLAADELIVARVSLDEATQKILSDGKSRVLGASAETIDGKEVHVIKVLTPDGRILHFKIDAETGAVIN